LGLDADRRKMSLPPRDHGFLRHQIEKVRLVAEQLHALPTRTRGPVDAKTAAAVRDQVRTAKGVLSDAEQTLVHLHGTGRVEESDMRDAVKALKNAMRGHLLGDHLDDLA
jgi:hypothetical protein